MKTVECIIPIDDVRATPKKIAITQNAKLFLSSFLFI
jgi:hypothetical protein